MLRKHLPVLVRSREFLLIAGRGFTLALGAPDFIESFKPGLNIFHLGRIPLTMARRNLTESFSMRYGELSAIAVLVPIMRGSHFVSSSLRSFVIVLTVQAAGPDAGSDTGEEGALLRNAIPSIEIVYGIRPGPGQASGRRTHVVGR